MPEASFHLTFTPSGLFVEIENEDEALAYLEEAKATGQYIPLDSEAGKMIQEWAKDRGNWEELKEEEQEYTQHMKDSKITFHIFDVDVSSKTVTFTSDLPGLSFDKPLQMLFVGEGKYFDFLDTHTTAAYCAYRGPIAFRTDWAYSTEQFSWYVAHESYHRYEQLQGPSLEYHAWYLTYITEYQVYFHKNDRMPSEIRANLYANTVFPYHIPSWYDVMK